MNFHKKQRVKMHTDLDKALDWVSSAPHIDNPRYYNNRIVRHIRFLRLNGRKGTLYTMDVKIPRYGRPEIVLSLGSMFNTEPTKIETVTENVEDDLEDISEDNGMAGLGAIFE